MTVKELKEKLEYLILYEKEDYTVFVDDFVKGFYEDISIIVNDLFNEIVITNNSEDYEVNFYDSKRFKRNIRIIN